MRFNLKALEEMTHEKDGGVKSLNINPICLSSGRNNKTCFLGFLRDFVLTGNSTMGTVRVTAVRTAKRTISNMVSNL